jgi:Mrp family chromosome partitioning ATPase
MRKQIKEASFEKIRLRLISSKLLECPDGRAASIGIVSRLRGEGATTVCIGLACASAANGSRVLLIDASGIGTRAYKILGLEQTVIDPAKDRFEISRHVAKAEKFGFDALAVSDFKPDASEWKTVWAELESRYDIVLVDTGSLEHETPYRWQPAVRHMVLVIDPQRSTYEILGRFKADLDHSALRLSGFVMNKRAFPIPSFLYRLAS